MDHKGGKEEELNHHFKCSRDDIVAFNSNKSRKPCLLNYPRVAITTDGYLTLTYWSPWDLEKCLITAHKKYLARIGTDDPKETPPYEYIDEQKFTENLKEKSRSETFSTIRHSTFQCSNGLLNKIFEKYYIKFVCITATLTYFVTREFDDGRMT